MSPQVRIINPISGPGWTSAKRAEKICAKGRGYMQDGDLVLTHGSERNSAPLPQARPMRPARLNVSAGDWLHDLSGGFLRYPMPMQTTGGLRFPALGLR